MLIRVTLVPIGRGLRKNWVMFGPFMSFYPNVSCLYPECREPLDVENHTEVCETLRRETHTGDLICPKCGGLHSVEVNLRWGIHIGRSRVEQVAQKR